MKQAKQRARTRPRNPLAIAPILRKGGAHQRTDKRAGRARLKQRLRREAGEA